MSDPVMLFDRSDPVILSIGFRSAFFRPSYFYVTTLYAGRKATMVCPENSGERK